MSKKHWSNYWATGALTSLPSDFKENYDGELAEFWHNVIDQLDTNSKVLDLCTGNGAVALLINEVSETLGKSVQVTAVDASNINPELIIQNYPHKKKAIQSIEFIANCYVEQLSEKIQGCFDLVVSQYGIEYCDLESAALQVFKVLKPHGKFVFVAHSADTAMMKHMLVEEQAFQLLEDIRVFNDFKQFVKNQISANGFKNKLEQHLNQLSKHELRNHDLVKSWGQNMYQLYQMNNNQLKQCRTQVGSYLNDNLNARARAKDMIGVTEKLRNDAGWYKSFTKAGLTLQSEGEIIHQSKYNVGHYYQFIKL